MSTDEKGIHFGGKLTLQEFIQYNLYVTKKEQIRLFFIAILIGVVCFQLGVPNIWLGSSILIALILAFSMIPVVRLLITSRAKREYKSDQLIQNDMIYAADHDGIKQKIKKSNSHFEWIDIVYAIEHHDMFLLHLSKRKAIVLPKRYYSTDEEVQSFKHLISANLPPKKIKFREQ